MLYELATGERPFSGDTSVSLLTSIIRDTPRPATDLKPALPRELSRIIKQCLVKDAEYRYQSAKDVRNELRALQRQAYEDRSSWFTWISVDPRLDFIRDDARYRDLMRRMKIPE